MIIADLQVGLY